MSRTVKTNILLFIFTGLLTVGIFNCGEDTILNTNNNTPDTSCADSIITAFQIKGKVNFVDTNFVRSGGVYLISAYPRGGWPPMGGPAVYDTIRVSGTNTSYCYVLKGFTSSVDTDYVVTVGFRKSTAGQSPVMSVYGCDTNHALSCWFSNPATVRVGPSIGVKNVTMLSWADTSKKVY